jgi:methyl-accepting chemotaxis protein
MQWYRDLKTVTKLMIGFGIMALFMGVLGFQGVRSIRAVNTETTSMYEHHVLGLTYLKDANLQLRTAGKSIRNAMLTDDAKDLEVRIGELHANRDTFLSDIEEFRKLLLSDAAKAKTAALLEEFYINAREQDKVVEMLRSHKLEQAIAHLTVLNTLQKKREELS